jgi:eukaryotic-like serine/threonine-protein kinase
MVCARCGHASSSGASRCPKCGGVFTENSVATGVIPIDTTGLPPGSTFGPDATIGPGATMTPAGPGDAGATMAPGAGATMAPGGAGATMAPGGAGATMAGAGATIGATIGDGATIGPTPTIGGTGLAPQTEAGPLKVGTSFGPRYHLIKLLGAGGMGAVYQAWDAELGVAVALKVIRSGKRRVSAELEKRFKNELLLARSVTHKNVVRIHDLGEIDGTKYITMSYVQGHDLSTLLQSEGKFPVARALALARQIAAGLEAAHDAGVVHRDLKPANIMISKTGDDESALIMDFGISASAEQATAGGVIGTLEYMAPEQATGQAVDGRADIYAFGLILYELLTGPRLNPAITVQERIEAMKYRTTEGVVPVRTVDPSIPAALESVVTRCVERDAAVRFQSTKELVAALGALDEAGELIPIARRLTKSMMAAATVSVVLLLGGTYYATRKLVTPPKAHDPVSVVIADFQNGTGDSAFDRTLEPVLKLALEGAGFISAYDRAGISGQLGVRPPEKLDERAALEIAVKQGLGVVLSGSLERQGSGYAVSVRATQAVSGTVITSAKNRASNRDQVLSTATKLATAVRKALGDDTSDSVQRFAMDTLSATSLDVIREYAPAVEALANGRFEEARQRYSKVVTMDPNFGLGYVGLAVASRNLDKQQDAEKYINQAIGHLDGMTERERYRTRGSFFRMTGDYPQCVKEYSDLIARYAADAWARNQLALCLTYLRKIPEAVDEMRQVVKIVPKRVLFRANLTLYFDYASEFQAAEQEARAMPEPGLFGLLALAFAQLGQGQVPQAIETYQSLAKIDQQGASYTASGLGDLALYEGRFSAAARIFTEGAASDLSSKDTDRAANKFAALAYTQLLRQQKGAAISAADSALANSKAVKIRFLAARVFVEAGAAAKARALAAGLASELQAEPQAYAKIVDGEAALKNGDPRQAIKVLTEANTLLDTWMGHFDLGRAFLEEGMLIQADSEFERCLKRRGEALALFLDEEPTFGYLPPVYYYQGLVRERMKSARFAESYRTYLTIRGQSKEDALLAEVRRRAGR